MKIMNNQQQNKKHIFVDLNNFLEILSFEVYKKFLVTEF